MNKIQYKEWMNKNFLDIVQLQRLISQNKMIGKEDAHNNLAYWVLYKGKPQMLIKKSMYEDNPSEL